MKLPLPKSSPTVIDVTDEMVIELPDSDPWLDADVEATVTVGGDITGQVAIGNNIVQMRVDTLHGNVVQVVPSEHAPLVRPRPRPLHVVPRRAGQFLDRDDAVAAASAAVPAAQPLEFHGPSGVGKSTLLRHLAHHPLADSLPGGIAHLSARGMAIDDLLQSLFDMLFTASHPYRPSRGALRQHMSDAEVLFLLDDTGLRREEAEELFDVAPVSGFVMCSTERTLAHHAFELTGLPEDDALAVLLSGRPDVTEAERVAAAAVCRALDGRPAALLAAAGLLRSGQASVDSLLDTLPEVPFQALAQMGDRRRRLLAPLAVVPGLLLSADQARAVTGDSEAGRLLDEAAHDGLVEVSAVTADQTGYSMSPAVADAARIQWDLSNAAERLRAYFRSWALERLPRLQAPTVETVAARQWLSWAAAQGQWQDVHVVAATLDAVLARNGHWAAWGQILESMLSAARHTGSETTVAFVLHQLGTRALCRGDVTTADQHLRDALERRERLGDVTGAATTRHNLQILRLLFPTVAGGGSFLRRALQRVSSIWGAGLLVLAAVIVALVAGWYATRAVTAAGSIETSVDALDFGRIAVSTAGPTQRVTLTNVGEDSIDSIRSFVDNGDVADFTVVATTCDGGLAGGASCTVDVGFTPTDTGPRHATLRLVSPDVDHTVRVSGTGSRPPSGGIEVTPTALDFGAVEVESDSNERVVTVTNTGASIPTALTLEVTGAHRADFGVGDTTCTAPLGEGDDCQIAVRFTPSVAETRGATLVIGGPLTDNAVGLTGTGTDPSDQGAGTAGVAISPTTVDFGDTEIGTSATRTVTVTNTGDQSLEGAITTIGGAHAGDFAVAGSDCGTTLSAGDDCTLRLAFRPSGTSVRTASLIVTGPDREHSAALRGTGIGTGTGTGTALQVRPGAVDFGIIELESRSAARTITVTNTGDLTAGVVRADLGGDHPDDFTLDDGGCGAALEGGDSCTLELHFRPTAIGARTATVTLRPAAGELVAVPVTGAAFVAVPDVLNEPQASAMSALREAGFAIGEVTSRPSGDVSEGQVLDQRPEGGTRVTADPQTIPVDLVVSSGPEGVPVPNVIGARQAEAVQLLAERGLEAKIDHVEGDVDADVVREQDPSPGTMVSGGDVVLLTVVVPRATTTVPSLIGAPRGQVAELLAASRLRLGQVSTRETVDSPAGTVIDQSPKSGADVPIDSTVDVTFAVAPQRVIVPDLIGLTHEEAVASLEELGLEASPAQVDSAQRLWVRAQSPREGTTVPLGTTVTLTLQSPLL